MFRDAERCSSRIGIPEPTDPYTIFTGPGRLEGKRGVISVLSGVVIAMIHSIGRAHHYRRIVAGIYRENQRCRTLCSKTHDIAWLIGHVTITPVDDTGYVKRPASLHIDINRQRCRSPLFWGISSSGCKPARMDVIPGFGTLPSVCMVRAAGLEPARLKGQGILSRLEASYLALPIDTRFAV